MELGESPPKANLQSILSALKIKTIDELLTNQQLSIDSLAKTTNNHKLIVQEYLATIQKQITKPFTPLPKVTIPLQPVFQRWGRNASEGQAEVRWSIVSSSIVEIVGRANGGKSYFLNEMMVECLKAKQKIIYLDSNQNLQKLSLRIAQELQENSELKEQDIWFKHLQFKNLCELAMLLHSLGNELYTPKEPYFIFIDSLGRSEEPQYENNPSASSMEFKFVDKFKKLLLQMAQRVGGVVYATRCSNSNILFTQTYKSERHRPKWVGSTPKQWDSIADKTFCVDYTRTTDDGEYWRMISTKAISNQLITLSRK